MGVVLMKENGNFLKEAIGFRAGADAHARCRGEGGNVQGNLRRVSGRQSALGAWTLDRSVLGKSLVGGMVGDLAGGIGENRLHQSRNRNYLVAKLVQP
jgi:hypothetical protein